MNTKIMQKYWSLFGVCLCAFLVYLGTASEVLTAAHDSASYMVAIMTGPSSLFHPFHLIFNGIARSFIELMSSLGYTGEPHQSVGVLNAFLGSVSIGTCYWILTERLRLQAAAARWGTVLVGCSYSMWYHSGAVEVFALSTAFSLLLINVLLKTYRSDRDHGWVICFFTGAVLAHVTSVFLFVPIVWSYMRRSDAKALIRVTTISGVLVIGIYSIAMLGGVGVRSIPEAVDWLRGISSQDQFWHRPWHWSTWVKVMIGAGRAIVGGHFIMALDPIYQTVQSLFPDKWMMDERFLVRGLGIEVVFILLLSCVGVFAGMLWAFARFRWVIGHCLRRHYPFWIIMSLWIVPLTGLLFIWEPHNYEYWIPFSLFLWMALTIVLSRARRPHILAGLATLLFFVNFVGSIVLTQNRENDFYYHHLEPVIEKPGGFGVVAGRSWQYRQYLAYYCPDATLLAWDSLPYQEAARQIVEWPIDQPLYVLPNAIQLERAVVAMFPILQYNVSAFWKDYPHHLTVLDWSPMVFEVVPLDESTQ